MGNTCYGIKISCVVCREPQPQIAWHESFEWFESWEIMERFDKAVNAPIGWNESSDNSGERRTST